ncbi:MAG: hypothetical protein EWM47_05145, partial [Anaerolineaceae bacterium]
MKKRSMKLLALFLSLVMVFGALTACGSKDADDKPTTKTDTDKPDTKKPDTKEPTGGDTKDTPSTDEAGTDEPLASGELPRNETMYFGGQQWG